MSARKLKWLLPGTLVVILLSALIWGSVSRAIEAFAVVWDVAAGKQESPLKKDSSTATRSAIGWKSNGRSYSGDLYRPGKGSRSRLLLIPGAAEEGKDDPRLIAFATTLAGARFTVLVPDLKGLKEQRVQSSDVREVVDSFIRLASLPDDAPSGKGGICAFSYSTGPALLASLHPDLLGRVKFVVGVGGYYDLPEVLTFVTTGYFKEEGEWKHRTPNEYGKWVFVLSNLERVSDAQDRELLRLIATRKIASLSAKVEEPASRLGPEGRSLYEFIVNRDPARVPLLISRLPRTVEHEITALNLANKDLSSLQAKLILVHGLDDDIIPYPQSAALARALPSGRAELFLARGLFHVDVKGSVRDGWQLWRAILALLRERDA